MKQSAFSALTISDQLGQLWRKGVYIGKRKEDGRVITIYQLESFYVEIYYRKYRSVIEHIVISEDPLILEPYLEQIEVEI